MVVKAKKKSKQALLDPFTKRLLAFLFITVPLLAYLILKPNPETQASNLEQTKAFAQFIQTKPELAQRGVASTVHAPIQAAKPVQGMPVAQVHTSSNGGAEAPADPNASLTLDDRIAINDMATQWNQINFVRDQTWRDQIETMFSMAERTQSEDIYDLLRRQIILGKVDDDQSNRIRAETWYERYMRLENRAAPRKEMEDLFIHNGQ